MKLVIATPLYPPQIGGPATYSKALKEALERAGHVATTISYGKLSSLPSGLRHLIYFFHLIPATFLADAIITMDTFSAGYPSVLAAKIFGKPVIMRVSGDFLWEGYVERTKEKIILAEFYRVPRKLTFKESIIRRAIDYVIRRSDHVVFQNAWQREIWLSAYPLNSEKTTIIENMCVVDDVSFSEIPGQKLFLWAGRNIFLKNVDMLREAFAEAKKIDPEIILEISPHMTHAELMKKIRGAYALLLPSLSENSPNFIIEGIQYGKPFIMTRETGLRDRVGELGILADPLDVSSWRDAILHLADAQVYETYVARIKNFRYVHTYDDIAEEFISLLVRP